MKIELIYIFMSMFIFSKPSVSSHIETQSNLRLIVVCGLNNNGFIDINKEKKQVKYYFSCGWGNGGNGITDLDNIKFDHKGHYLIMVYKTTEKTIFKIKCNQVEFDVIKSFLAKNVLP